MKNQWKRALALVLCALMLVSMGLAESPDADVSAAGAPETLIPEAEVDVLASEPAANELLAGADEEATDDPEDGEEPQDPEAEPQDPEAEAGEEAPAPPAIQERFFSKTRKVQDATWQNVNLSRIVGFQGPFAKVGICLKLVNVDIGGVPARKVNLLDCFELASGATIVIQDQAPLSLSPAAFSIAKEDKRALEVTLDGKRVSGKQAQWASDNPKIASVSKSGVITAKKKGVARITATCEGHTAACLVKVTNDKPVKSVKMSASKMDLALYNTGALKAKVKPSDAGNTRLVWKSSKPDVVAVDGQGGLTALALGKATITATAVNGESAKCVVTVVEVSPKSVDFANLYVTLHPGESFDTKVSLKPEKITYPQVLYASSDPAVAEVDENGRITAVGIGAATITCVAETNQKAWNTCKVFVIAEGAKRMEGVIVGINPGHQKKTIKKHYPIAPGSHKKGKGVKTGACGRWTRVNEYETVLQIGLKLRKLLEDEGATVVMTRTTNDVMLTNIDRARMLNKAGVDVALQLHCNGSSNHRSHGCSAYYRNNSEWVAESKRIAKAMVDCISKKTGCKNRGIRVHNEYMSLNWTTTLSALVEMGYLSNRKEDKLLATDSYRQKMAEGLLEALHVYFDR